MSTATTDALPRADAGAPLSRRRRLIGALVLGLIVLGTPLTYWRCFCCYGIVKRVPQRVPDVPTYGDELRAQELNPPEPAGPTPAYGGAGHYLRWSPDQTLLAVSTNAAGYYLTINVWNERERQLKPVISIEESDPGSGRDYRYAWSRDSKALLIYGGGSVATGEHKDPIPTSKLCMVYLPQRDELYWINPCHRTRWAY